MNCPGTRQASREAASRPLRAATIAMLAVLLAAGCAYPRDPSGSLERAAGSGELRVGVADAPPFALAPLEGEPGGAELELLRGFAEVEGLEVEFIGGTEGVLLEGLRRRRLDIVVGGFTTQSPWRRHVGMTRPYLEVDVVTALVGDDATEPRSLEGVRVAHDEAQPAIGAMLEERGATPVPVADPARADEDVAALEDFRAAAAGMSVFGEPLHTSRHVMAVERGENRLLVALERHLHERVDGRDIRRLLAEEGA